MNRNDNLGGGYPDWPVWRSLLFVLLICLLVVAFLFPSHLLLETSPMIGSAWSLQDPGVSGWVFLPGLKVLQYEILQNHNFLWSNLKGLGMPLLGNELQEAPLYPLTLALLWVPEPYFWNVFVVLRWLILGSGAFFLASFCFRLKPAGALVFVLTFVFSFYHLRWMNHPFLNGIAAGTWYLFFLLSIIQDTGRYVLGPRMTGLLIGLSIAAYSVLTCGFPESSLTVAAITLMVTPIFVVRRISINRYGLITPILVVGAAHMIALVLAAPQLLSLIEFIELTNPGFRGQHGLHQINEHLGNFFLKQLMWSGAPKTYDHFTHIFGLIPVFLFLLGLLRIVRSRGLEIWAAAAVLFCVLFFLAKNFAIINELIPFTDRLHRLVGTLPIAKQMWWTGYAYPLVLICFAYFAGRGIDEALQYPSSGSGSTNSISISNTLPIICITLLVASLAASFSQLVMQVSLLDLLKESKEVLQIIATFILFAILVLCGPYLFRSKRSRSILASLVLFLLLMELRIFMPHNRMSISKVQSLTSLSGQAKQVDELLHAHGLNRYDYRFTDFGSHGENFGFLIDAGLSSFKNGAAAIYTHRQQLFRQHVLGADWDGYFPIIGQPTYDGWARSSAGLFMVSPNLANQASVDKIPLHLFRAGRIKEFVQEIIGIAKDISNESVLIKRHEQDLFDAINTSSSDTQATQHSLLFLTGVSTIHPDLFDPTGYKGRLSNLDNIIHETPIQLETVEIDRVGCSSTGLSADGSNDNVFILDTNSPTNGNPWHISHIELIRQHPNGVNRTSNRNFVLGVARGPNDPLLNSSDGRVKIPLNSSVTRLFLFACADGQDTNESRYKIRLTMEDPSFEHRFRKLGSIGLPLHLLESGHSLRYVEVVADLAREYHGATALIDKYTQDLLNAINSSSSAAEAFHHTIHFLKGVGARNLHELLPKGVYLDSMALPRAYVPTACGLSSDIADSLEKIKAHQFDLPRVIIENASEVTRDVCLNHDRELQRVQIETDRGSSITLAEIQGPSIIVLNDYFYPGWHAVDQLTEESIEIHPANLAFRALTLPEARTYRLKLTYRPDWLVPARYSVLFGLIVLILLVIFVIFRAGKPQVGLDNCSPQTNRK